MTASEQLGNVLIVRLMSSSLAEEAGRTLIENKVPELNCKIIKWHLEKTLGRRYVQVVYQDTGSSAEGDS